MPLSGIGVAPPAGSLFDELSAVTRRAFVPKLIVQIYFASPTLFYLMGNAQRAAGGLNQVTVPLQGQSMVQGQFTGYSGGFNSPVIIPGIQNGQWNLAFWVVPIPLPFGESVLQATERVDHPGAAEIQPAEPHLVLVQRMGVPAAVERVLGVPRDRPDRAADALGVPRVRGERFMRVRREEHPVTVRHQWFRRGPLS